MSDEQALEPQAKAMTVARIYFESHLRAAEATAYLNKRELSPAACKRFNIGYAPDDWRGLVNHFKSHSVRLAAKDAGLLSTPNASQRLLDFFRNRIIFPIRNASGDLVGYGGRDISGKEGTPKYINTPETELFKKGHTLYGLYENKEGINAKQSALIVEGYMDVVRLTDAGFNYAVAPMGTALTSEQIDLLLDHGAKKIFVCLDGDNAGRNAAKRSIDLLMQRYTPLMEIYLVAMPDGDDPDSLIRTQGASAFQDALNKPITLIEHIAQCCTEGLRNPPSIEDMAIYLQRMGGFIEQASGALQDQLIEQAQAFTGLPADKIYAGKQQREDNKQAQGWHPLVMMASRWMMHDANPTKVAAHLSQLNHSKHGIQELNSLANQVIKGESPTGLLAEYAKAHGPLNKGEVECMREHWTLWRQKVQLDSALTQLRAMPFDQGAKDAIKKTAPSLAMRF